MKKAIIIILALMCHIGVAQTLDYNWEDVRSRYDLGDNYKDDALINIKYHVQYEYVYEGEGDLYLYQTEHQIIRANNDNALERSNRIYIPMHDAIELVKIKARTINADGKVIVFDESEIKELEDEESGTGYKIFAIEGAEVGSEIEYFYTKKANADYFGREYFQFSEPVIKGSFVLITPDNLEFAFKSYNGLPEVTLDNLEETNVYTMVVEDVPALKEEAFSSYKGSKMRLEYKLAYNHATNKKLFTWSDASQVLYSRAFRIDKDDDKLIDKMMGEIDLKNFKTLTMKIRAVEDYIKNNFYLNENASYEASNISFMMKNRIGSKLGLTKLMINALKEIGAQPQLVLTSERNEVPFDGDFESYNYLQEYLVYIPADDAFIAPYSREFRYGMVPSTLTATTGLFIEEITEDELNFPQYKIKSIPALSAGENLDKMEVGVTFNEDLTSNTIDLTRTFNGYQSAFIKAVFPLIEEERKEDLLKELVKFMAADADIITLGLKDNDFNFINWNDPLIIQSKFKSPSFIELAGDIVLLKVGDMIGPQTELYQENERMTRVENDFNREYKRYITIQIPKGYNIENLEDLILDDKVTKDGKDIYYFKSSYTLKGQELKIEILEGYEEIYYPKEEFEPFRKVINAAADWNKIVLVMSKG